MQPYALLVALPLFFAFKVKINKLQLSLFFLLVLAFLVFLVGGISLITIRSFFNYASLFFISYVAFKVLRSKVVNFEFLLKSFILVWFFVGFLQVFYKKSFLTFLVSSARTTADRGVTGLAPEPTFYGIVMIFFIIFLLQMNLSNKKFYIFLCVFSIIFFAKSSMAVLFLAIMFFLYVVTHASLKCLLIAFLALFFAPFISMYFLEGSRLFFLITKLIEDPSGLVLVDASINDRFFHIFFSIKGFFDSYFFPNGFLSWNQYVERQVFEYRDLVIVEWFSVGGRIMSGYGSAFYELGLFAVVVPFVIFVNLYSIYKRQLKKFFFFFIFVNVIMFSAIPIGFSLFVFYIGFIESVRWQLRGEEC